MDSSEHDGEAGVEEPSTSTNGSDEPGSKPTASSRRSLLKKGAVAPIVAGAVWAAPKIEGLSVVPDVAAAASGSSLVGPFNIPVPSEGFIVNTPFGPMSMGAGQGFSGTPYPTTVSVGPNVSGPCVMGTVNAVDSNTTGPPVTIQNQSGAPGFIIADLNFSSDVAFNLTSVTFDFLCT